MHRLLERLELPEQQEQQGHQQIFRFFQLLAHLLGLNPLEQNLFMLLLLLVAVVAGLGK
jgi:hypothetical protein